MSPPDKRIAIIADSDSFWDPINILWIITIYPTPVCQIRMMEVRRCPKS